MGGRFTDAIPVLESIIATQPENVEALYLLSDIYIHSTFHTNLEQAATLLEQILALDPQLHLVYFELPIIYGLQGENAKARRVLDEMELEHPLEVQEVRAFLRALEGHADEALRSSPSPGTAINVLLRGAYAVLTSEWEAALDHITSFGEPGWRRAVLRRLQGDVWAYRGEFEQAVDSYRDTLADEIVAPDGLWGAAALTGLHSLAELHALRGDFVAAGTEVQRALAVQPDSLRSLYLAGRHALRRGDAAQAAAHGERLREVIAGSRTSSGWIYRDALDAEIALDRGDAEVARQLLENVVRSGQLLAEEWAYFTSSGALFRDALARAHLMLGNTEDAVEELQRLIASGFERTAHPVLYVRALYQLGVLTIGLGREAEGHRYLEQFLDHWGNAGWDLPEVTDARAGLGR